MDVENKTGASYTAENGEFLDIDPWYLVKKKKKCYCYIEL